MSYSRGFIALISILVLSVALLIGVVSLAQYGITTRYALLDLERKATADSLARACLDLVRVAVVNDPAYTSSGKNVSVGSAICRVEQVLANTPSAGFSRAVTSASSTGATTNLKAEINTATGAITKLEELPTY